MGYSDGDDRESTKRPRHREDHRKSSSHRDEDSRRDRKSRRDRRRRNDDDDDKSDDDKYDDHDSESREERRRRRRRREKHRSSHRSSRSGRRRDDDRERSRHRRRDDDSSLESFDDEDRKQRKRKRSHRSEEHNKDSSESRAKHKLPVPPKSGKETRGDPPAVLLNPIKDYYKYHQHLWVYLHRERHVAFNDLTAEESKAAFASFVEEYNRGNLEALYYEDPLPPEILQQSRTTRHTWTFRTSAAEQHALESVQAGVRRETEVSKNNKTAGTSSGRSAWNTAGSAICRPARGGPSEPPARGGGSTGEKSRAETNHPQRDRRDGGAAVTKERSASYRQWKERARSDVHEELLDIGGNNNTRSGHERTLAQRHHVADKTHGASRAREEAVELGDDALYGSDGPSFQAALARRRDRAQEHKAKQGNRVAELQAKEQQRQQAMFEKLGLSHLQPGQKITIAPRNDDTNGK